MLFLTESYGYLNEEQLMQCSGAQFDSIFKKVDIYNRNIRLGKVVEGAYQTGNIVFTLNERIAIKDMLHMIQKNLIEGYAKENDIDLNAINEDFGLITDKIVSKMSGAWKDAIEFVTKMIKQGISNVKDFLKFFVQFFEKLGENANDCIRRSIKKLNVFGDDEELDSVNANESLNKVFLNSLLEAEKQKIKIADEELPKIGEGVGFEDIAQGKKEKSFLECVAEYIQNKVSGKKIQDLDESYMFDEYGDLNEGKISDWFQSKLANNKIYQSIAGSNASNWIKKFGSIWGTFMIGAVGSTICYTIIPLFLDTLKIAFPTVGLPLMLIKWAVKLGYLGWQLYKIIKNRRKQIEDTGDKLVNTGFCIQLIMSVGFFIIGQTGGMSALAGKLGQSEIGAEVVKVAMYPIKLLMKVTGVEYVTTSLTNIAGKLVNDMAIKFAEIGFGDFAGMSAQTFSETMSKLFASYNLSWKGITGGETGGIPAKIGKEEMMKIEDVKGINQAVKDSIKGHANEVRHNGTNQQALKDIKWESTGADGTKHIMQTASENGRVDALIMDPRGVDGGKWLHFKDFANQLHSVGIQMDMSGTEGLKVFTHVDGSPLSTEDLAIIKNIMDKQVAAGNISVSATFLPMTINNIVDIPAPDAKVVEPLINIPVMTFAERLNNQKPGNIFVILGTNTAEWGPYSKEAMLFSKIEDKTMADAIGEISSDGKSNVEEVGKYLQDLIAKVNMAKENVNESEESKHEVKDHQCAILYVKKDDKDIPAILFDYETMLAADLIKQPGRKEIRKTPYYFAGLLGSLFMRPSYDIDQLKPERKPSWLDFIKPKHDYESAQETRSEIVQTLCAIIAKGVKANFNLVGKNFVQYDNKEKKYIKNPNVETDGPIPQLGNCTIDQYLDVLNAKIEKKISKDNIKPLMNVLSAGNKRDVKMFIKGELPAFDENGLSQESKKSKNTHIETKEDKENYIKNKLYPNLNNHDGEFYKELSGKRYKQISKWLLDEDGNVKLDILTSDKVSNYLLRTEQSYELDTKRSWKEIVKAAFKDENVEDNEKVENQNIQVLVALIWKHYKEFEFDNKEIIDKWGVKDTEKQEEKQESNSESEKKNKSDAWFENVITSRINKPTKTLYKELLDNETIKNYYKLSNDKANINSINNDKALHFVLYNRFKTGKQPSENYWAKKVPSLIMKMQKASKHEVNEEKANKKSKVIREFYNIINKYARRDRNKDTKKLWKKMQTENVNTKMF